MALARPDRRVAVITGDGDVLMALGSLATIGVKQPENLSIVCLDNGHYSATGMQPSATSSGVDLGGGGAACRLRVESVYDLSRADELRTLLHSGEGPLFIHARSMPTIRSASSRAATASAIKHRFMQAWGRQELVGLVSRAQRSTAWRCVADPALLVSKLGPGSAAYRSLSLTLHRVRDTCGSVRSHSALAPENSITLAQRSISPAR